MKKMMICVCVMAAFTLVGIAGGQQKRTTKGAEWDGNSNPTEFVFLAGYSSHAYEVRTARIKLPNSNMGAAGVAQQVRKDWNDQNKPEHAVEVCNNNPKLVKFGAEKMMICNSELECTVLTTTPSTPVPNNTLKAHEKTCEE